jgi:hypothetical protein
MDEKEVWATSLARTVLDRHEKEQLQRRHTLAEQELVKNKASDLWDELQKEVKTHAEALNLAMGQGHPIQFRQLEMYKFELVVRDGMYSISFHFNPNSTRLEIRQINNNSSNFEIKTVHGTPLWTYRNVGNTSVQIAKSVLEDTAKFI